jgi:hypothetical protein
MIGLLFGTAHAAMGIEDDLTYLVGRLRAAWPDVQINIRGDSGFGVPKMYDVCEDLRLDYTLGLGMNAVLKRQSEAVLAVALQKYEETGQPQRLFTSLWYQAKSWRRPRFVIIKAEAHAQGTNRRAVVSNRPGASLFAEATDDECTERGESENRNKELKCGMAADRRERPPHHGEPAASLHARRGGQPAGSLASGGRRGCGPREADRRAACRLVALPDALPASGRRHPRLPSRSAIKQRMILIPIRRAPASQPKPAWGKGGRARRPPPSAPPAPQPRQVSPTPDAPSTRMNNSG